MSQSVNFEDLFDSYFALY